MSVILKLQSKALNHPEDERWYELGNQDLTAHHPWHDVDYVLSHYMGIPEYDVEGLSATVSALYVALQRSGNTSKVAANYVGRYDEYRFKLEA